MLFNRVPSPTSPRRRTRRPAAPGWCTPPSRRGWSCRGPSPWRCRRSAGLEVERWDDGEGSNHSSSSHQNSVKILSKFRKIVLNSHNSSEILTNFRTYQHFLECSAKFRENFITIGAKFDENYWKIRILQDFEQKCEKRLTNFCKDFEFGAVRRSANLVDLAKC